MDEVFPECGQGSFGWETRSGINLTIEIRLSSDHEHILVYPNETFAFRGEYKDFGQYKKP